VASALSTLEQRVQTLYDVSGSTVLSAAELDQFINDAYRKLWSEVLAINKNFRIKSLPFTLVAGGQAQALPADFMEERYVRLNPGQENQVYLTRNNLRTGSMNYDRSYDIFGTNLVIEPLQRSAGSYSLDYIPQPPVLAAPTDALDVELDQFSDFLVYDAAIVALAREESDAGQLVALCYGVPGDPSKPGIIGRVRRWASDKRSASPDRVEDVRRRSPWMFVPP
jgi:hypothetical protein